MVQWLCQRPRRLSSVLLTVTAPAEAGPAALQVAPAMASICICWSAGAPVRSDGAAQGASKCRRKWMHGSCRHGWMRDAAESRVLVNRRSGSDPMQILSVNPPGHVTRTGRARQPRFLPIVIAAARPLLATKRPSRAPITSRGRSPSRPLARRHLPPAPPCVTIYSKGCKRGNDGLPARPGNYS